MAFGRLMSRSSRSAGSAWAGAGVAGGHGRRRWPIWSTSPDLPVLADALGQALTALDRRPAWRPTMVSTALQDWSFPALEL